MFNGKSQRQRSYSFSKIGRQSLSDVGRLWTFPGAPGNEGNSWMLGMFLGDKLLLFHSKHSKGHGRENDPAREHPTVDKWSHWNTRKKERAGFQEVALEEEEVIWYTSQRSLFRSRNVLVPGPVSLWFPIALLSLEWLPLGEQLRSPWKEQIKQGCAPVPLPKTMVLDSKQSPLHYVNSLWKTSVLVWSQHFYVKV